MGEGGDGGREPVLYGLIASMQIFVPAEEECIVTIILHLRSILCKT